MKSRMMSFALVSFFLVALVCSSSALAQQGVGGSWTGYTHIPSSTKQLTFDHMLIVDYDSRELVTNREILWSGGLAFSYFVIQNLGVGLNVGYFWNQNSVTTTVEDTDVTADITDSGLIGFLTAEYYVRLGENMFLRPGLGVGYYLGTRETPLEGTEDALAQSDISGFAGRLDLGASFYTSRSVSLRASIMVLARLATETIEATEANVDPIEESATLIDAGFSLGVGYAF